MADSVLGIYQKLLEAYRICVKNKPRVRRTPFHLHHESILIGVSKKLANGTWHPGVSTVFVVTKPKAREVVAAQMSDRVVHHFLCAWMMPWWERRFSPFSYACRPGKGPLQASKELRSFIKGYEHHKGRPLWCLKMDVSNFFPSIDHDVLMDILRRRMKDGPYLRLCETIVRHRPVAPGQFRLASDRGRWRLLSKRKSLFYAAPGKGLPIGNLTSQFFANVYMNELDQYIARDLKDLKLYWQRYVDDILLLSDDPVKLKIAAQRVGTMLRERLKLELNPRKTTLQPVAKGVDHLGYFHQQRRIRVRRRVVRAAKQKIDWAVNGAVSGPDICAAVNSYLGHFRQADSLTLRRDLCIRLLSGDVSEPSLTVNGTFTAVSVCGGGSSQWGDDGNSLLDDFAWVVAHSNPPSQNLQ